MMLLLLNFTFCIFLLINIWKEKLIIVTVNCPGCWHICQSVCSIVCTANSYFAIEAFCWQTALLWAASGTSLMVPSSFTISSTFPSPEGLPGAQWVKVKGLPSVQLHCPEESWVPPIKALELIKVNKKLLVFWSGTDAKSPPLFIQWSLASFQDNVSSKYL